MCSEQILFGCAAQYMIMPAFGAIVGRAFGLPPSLYVGLILLACCPGGTASNVVTFAISFSCPVVSDIAVLFFHFLKLLVI